MRRGWRILMALGLLAGLMPLLPVGVAVADDAVVAAPCLEGDFNTALATALMNGGGTITFACGGATTINFTNLKTITAGNTVIIEGADLITLDGGGTTQLFQVNGGATLELRNLTLSNGSAVDGGAIINAGVLRVTESTLSDNTASDSGGAIASLGGMTVVDSDFSSNTAADGGAIVNAGVMQITGSTFTGNIGTATFAGAVINFLAATIEASNFSGNSSFFGGAIVNNIGAALDLTGSTLDGNTALGVGGGIFNSGTITINVSTLSGNMSSLGGALHNVGSVDLTFSTLSGNSAGDGGAIFNDEDATVSITRSTLNGNVASTGNGGGIVNDDDGTITIMDSVLTGNLATAGVGGALYSAQGAGAGLISITGSTLDGNQAGSGGALFSNDPLEIADTTISNNIASSNGGAIFSNSTTTVTTSTLSGNNATTGGATFSNGPQTFIASTITNNAEDGLTSNNTITLRQTIVADQASGDDCVGTVASNDFNLDSDNSCSLIGANDISGGGAELGLLADNGGPTQTHLPSLTSDAFDNGPMTCPSPDQRGQMRPAGDGCDIGSVELQSAATYPLCVQAATGQVLSPLTGPCGPGQFELNVPEIYPTTFCIDVMTGILYFTFSGVCNPPRQAHLMPDDGDLLTCVHRYTRVNRRVMDAGQCTPFELPNLIPSAL